MAEFHNVAAAAATKVIRAAASAAAAPKKTQKADPNRVIRVWRADNYPKQMWIMLGIVMFLISCVYWAQLVNAWRIKRTAAARRQAALHKSAEAAKAAASNKMSIRRLPSAFANAWRIALFRFTLPIGWGQYINGAETVVACGYIIAIFVWTFINCTDVVTHKKLNVQYYSNRAGNIAIFQMPLMTLLSGKNNLITLITGIAYEKINFLHRVSARVCFILVLVHTYGRVIAGLTGNTSPSVFYMAIGIAATATYGVVFLLFRPLRAKFYNLFVFLHFVFILFTVIGSYFHTVGASGIGWIFYPTFVFWFFDRAVRLLRLGWIRYRSVASPKAFGDVLGDRIVRLTLRRKITWKPGQHFLVNMPSISKAPWEAHPFTAANIPGDRSLSGLAAEPLNGENDMTFFIRVKDGFTKRLRDAIRTKKNANAGAVEFPIYLEGPYGHSPEVDIYSNVVLIAGGSGITFILPILQHIVQGAKDNKNICRNLLFIWAVRSPNQFGWVEPALRAVLDSAPASLNVRIQLHATREGVIDSGSETSSRDEKEPESPAAEKKAWVNGAAGIVMKNGRPDLHGILSEEVQAAEDEICVTAAGPGNMAEDIRAALRFDVAGPKTIMRGGASVTLNIESFGIA